MYVSKRRGSPCKRGHGPPVLLLRGWTEGEPWGRLLCSGVLGKGQCTQLRSGGKCKTNMPHTCFPLSCHGSAFKDSPPSSIHKHTHIHTLHCASPFCSLLLCPQAQSCSPHRRVRGTAARPTQEGFLINTEPCGGRALQYCVSGQTGLSVFWLVYCAVSLLSARALTGIQ